MQSTPRQVAKFAPAIASFIAGVGVELSGYENFTLAVILWGAAVLLLGIPAWPWIKRWRPFTLAPAHNSHHMEPMSATPSTTDESDELKQLKNDLQEVRQERDSLREEHKELIAEKNALEEEYELLASQFVQEERLKQRARQVSDSLFRFAETRNSRRNALSDQVKGQYDSDTNFRYHRYLEAGVRALLRDLERYGWCDAEERKEIENIFESDSEGSPNERIIRGAARLAEFGKRL